MSICFLLHNTDERPDDTEKDPTWTLDGEEDALDGEEALDGKEALDGEGISLFILLSHSCVVSHTCYSHIC